MRKYKGFEITGNRKDGYMAKSKLNENYFHSDTLGGLKYKITLFLEVGRYIQ